MKNIEIETSLGTLRATGIQSEDYPGVKIYLDDVLFASVESYESDGLLRLIGYKGHDDEPQILETLITEEELNTKEDEEDEA